MLTTRLFAGALALVCFAMAVSPAEARHRHYRHHHFVLHLSSGRTTSGPMTCNTDGRCSGGGSMPEFSSLLPMVTARPARTDRSEIVAHPAGCPHTLFCGCGAAVRIFGHSVRSLWLAANWLRFPRAAPAPGMAAVRQHHVFVIEQVMGGGQVLAFDANSGRGLTRRHVVSLRGYVVVDPKRGG